MNKPHHTGKKLPKEPVNSGNLNRSLTALPSKGLSLKHPIYSSKVSIGREVIYCVSPQKLQLDLVCSSYELAISNPEGLVTEFSHWITKWLRQDLKKKRVSKKYPATLDMLLANLRRAQLSGRQLLTPLRKQSVKKDNPDNLTYNTINPTLAFLEARKFIKVIKGTTNEFDGACTSCEPTAELNNWFDNHNIAVRLHDEAELVIIRGKKTKNKKKERKEIRRGDRPKVKAIAQIVRKHNKVWLHHMATLDGKYLTTWCKRIFNNGSLEYGGRFYGDFQRLSKEDRARILIGGHQTTEPDFSALHPNILYAWAGEQISGDPYEIAGYDRSTIKAVMLPLLNSENLNVLTGQINKSSRPEIKGRHLKWKEDIRQYTLRKAQAIRVGRLEMPDHLKGFIEGIPEGINGEELVKAIKHKHSLIAEKFGTKNIGLRLQRADSRIMAAILLQLSARGIPALPIHDSIRVKSHNRYETIAVMKSQYQRIMGFDIEVK
jgi:hypothetical protein